VRTATFRVERNPAPDVLSAVARAHPRNPFFAVAYIDARRCLGDEPVVLGLWSDGARIAACPAYVRRARLREGLVIPSLPPIPESQGFWPGLLSFCRQHGLRLLTVETFGSGTPISIPHLAGELTRRTRREFVLALQEDPPQSRFSSNHRRNVARARGHGLSVRRTHETAACAVHDRLVHSSLDRRAVRGEAVPVGSDLARYEVLTRTRAAELFQAVRGEEVLSSLLVLRAEAGAYYQSAGTSPDGMAAGASHFLVAAIIACLRDEGLEVFNLGGADEDAAGLQRFKEGFGATQVPLEAAQFSTEPVLMRKARTVVRSLRTASRDLPARLRRRISGAP
jgi:hypothetical protein